MSTEAAVAKRWAREYETIYILRPNVDSAEAEKVATRVREVMERLGATLTKVDTWGRRRLAYTIKNHTRGIYVYLRYVGFNDIVLELERNLRLMESVLRHQTILLEEMVDAAGVTVDPTEVEFDELEEADEEPDLTFAQRLGLEERTRREEREPEGDGAKGDDAKGDDAKADDAKAAEAKSDDAPAEEAKSEEAPAAEAPAAEAKSEEAAKTDGEEA